MTYAIVAIPSNDDYVWNISSEKVPHITLLVLDDTLANVDRVTEYINHMADTSLSRFGLSVTSRGVLGPKSADVLFLGGYNLSTLRNVRSYLLDSKDIFVAYNSTEQFDSWTPHLTLGYPTNPAKPDTREYPGTYWINFDRIALWNDNSEGPEFPLKNTDDCAIDHSIDGATSNLVGGHKIIGPKGGNMPVMMSDKPWHLFTKSSYNLQEWINACLIHPAKPSKLKNDYKLPVREPDGTLNKNGIHAAASALAGGRGGVIASSTQKAIAAAKLMEFYKQMKEDLPSSITSMMQSEGDNALKHIGVRGMRWGVRKNQSSPSSAVVVTDSNSSLKTAGGHGAPASSDAIRAASAKQLAKKSGTKALSTQDLQHLVTRMNLEQQYGKLIEQQPSVFNKGHGAVKMILGVANTAQQIHTTLNSPLVKELRKLMDNKK